MITKEKVLTRQSIHLPGPVMSKLLGISLIEYYNLNHGNLEETRDRSGNIVYQLRVDEHNDAALLLKLKTDENRVVQFSMQEIGAANIYSCAHK